MNTQLLHAETQRPSPRVPSRTPPLTNRQVMICLAICMALQMTSFVVILPLFARRLTEFGAGVNALGISDMASALAATLSAPLMGALADRLGRRPLVLASLAVYIVAFTGYLLVTSASTFIVLRALAGALTTGLMPAATGMVADLAPENRRGQWIGVLSGGAAFGWIGGPVLGGLLYDRWGYEAAVLVSIGMATLAFVAALVSVRETRPHAAQPGTGLHPADLTSASRPALSVSLAVLAPVLFIYFAVMFAWAFIEPRFMFYAYDDLRWSSSMLGLVMSTYGVSMMLGELGLGRLSDSLGRKPVIVAGLVLFSAQFIGLAVSRNYVVIAVAFVIAGLGNALFDPALTSAVLDIAPSQHQARILGVKSTVGSLGNIAGPALVVLCSSLVSARGIFLLASGLVLLAMLTAVTVRSGATAGRKSLLPEVSGMQAS